MNKILTLAFTLLVTVVASAQVFNVGNNNYRNTNYYNQSSLVISTASSGKNYVVNVNNRYSYSLSNNNSNITLNNLGTGVQYIEVIQLKKNIFGNEKRETIYSGNVQLRQGFETNVSINVFNQVNVTERQVFFDNNNNNNNGGWNNNNGSGCNGHGKKGKANGHGKHKNKKGKGHNKCDND